MLGSDKEFVVTKARTHGPGHGAAYRCSEPSVIPLSCPGTNSETCFVLADRSDDFSKIYSGFRAQPSVGRIQSKRMLARFWG